MKTANTLICCAVSVALSGCAAMRGTAGRSTSPVYTSSADPGFIPAGTAVEVRTDEAIETTSADKEKNYSAEITREIIGGGGNVLVPKGSPVNLAVLEVSRGGTLTSGDIELGMRSITVNGKEYAVNTGTTTSGGEGLGANRRTATMVGGGAALGTLIGAIAGGGRGAAIGAAAGAAGGAAVQVLTKGKEVRVPAESILTFRLENPIQLTNYK